MYTVYVYFTTLIVIFLYSIGIKSTLNTRSRYLFFMIGITVLVEGIGLFYLEYYKSVAYWVFTIFHPLEFYLLAVYFKELFLNPKREKLAKSLSFTIPFLILVIGIASLNVKLPYWYNFLTSSVFIIFLSVLYFKELLDEKVEDSLLSNPDFYINIGILVFHSCSFLVMGLVNYIYKQNPELARQVFSINHILNIIYYSLIAYGFYIQWKSTKSSLSS